MEKNNINSKKVTKITIMTLIIVPLLLVLAIFFHEGFIQYPQWFLVADFKTHKAEFENVVEGNFRSIASNYVDRAVLKAHTGSIGDKELEENLYDFFDNNLWGEVFCMDYAGHKLCVFMPQNFMHSKARGIMYYEDDIYYFSFDGYYNCICKSIGDNWYYYEVKERIYG